jgi:hypothetical protein
MDINISGKVGKGVNSSPTDIAKIQNLLAAVGVYKLPNAPAAMPVTAKTPVKCPDDVVEAITSFQKFWGSSDGVVDPGGMTLRRLNKVAHPLHLQGITRKGGQTGIAAGGYHIRYTGELPPGGYSLLLHVDVIPPPVSIGARLPEAQEDNCLDLTDRATHQSDLMNLEKLKALLKIFDDQELWATQARAALIVERDGTVVSLSNVQPIDCPVQPYSGELGDNLSDDKLGEDDAPSLQYTGAPDGSGGGAIAYIPAIDGKYYFYYGDGFEINNSRRGFDCTTFAGAVLRISGNSGAMGGNGTDLANYLVNHSVACACDLDNAKESEVHDFFDEHPTGSYFAWSGGHVVLIKDAFVHEFTFGGYHRTPVATRKFAGHWSLRKITAGL